LEQELKNSSKLDDRIQFLDFQNQSEMPVIYRMANLFTLLSNSETWGLSINEALASGTKVLASKFCGGAIDLLNNKNGLICDLKTDEINKGALVSNLWKNQEGKKLKNVSILQGHSYKEVFLAVKKEISI
jgi:glycosyltransferase involved in cell wall biosynthesis